MWLYFIWMKLLYIKYVDHNNILIINTEARNRPTLILTVINLNQTEQCDIIFYSVACSYGETGACN